MNVKIFERLGYVNVEYGETLDTFFEALANDLLNSGRVSMLDSSETQPTLSEGKVAKKIPRFTKLNLIKLLFFIGIYLLRVPIFIGKRLLWRYRESLNHRLLRVMVVINYYIKVAEFSGFFCFVLGSLFESSVGFLLLSHGIRKIDWRFTLMMTLGIVFSLLYLLEIYYYLILLIRHVRYAEERGAGIYKDLTKKI